MKLSILSCKPFLGNRFSFNFAALLVRYVLLEQPVARVLRRVHVEHQRAARVERHVGVFTDGELARHDHRAADLRREGRGVAVHLDEVGVLHDVPVAAALELVGLPVDGILGPQPSEHLVVFEPLEAFGVVEVDALDRRCVPWVLLGATGQVI